MTKMSVTAAIAGFVVVCAAVNVAAQQGGPTTGGGTPPPIGFIPVVLKSEWPKPVPVLGRAPDIRLQGPRRLTDVEDPSSGPIGPLLGKPVPRRATPLEIGPGFAVYLPPIGGVDPMVAVGRNSVIVSQNDSLVFLDRSGAVLPDKNGVDGTPSFSGIFADFVVRGSPTDLNERVGFPKACDSPDYPLARGAHYCIAEFNDLRTYFDPGADRFFLVAQAHNAIWTDIWSATHKYQDDIGICGVYGVPGAAKTHPLPEASHCELARRHVVFAISKTEDPRDGFHTYAVLENNYRDWPWGAVNADGDTFVVGHKGFEMTQGMAAMLFRLSDLRLGAQAPAYRKLYPTDFQGLLSPAPVVHAGGALEGHTLLISSPPDGGDTLHLFAVPAPAGQGNPSYVVHGSTTIPDTFFPRWLSRTVYRNGALHMAWEETDPSSGTSRIKALRAAVTFPSMTLSTLPSTGFRLSWLGKDTPGSSAYDDDKAAIAVNAAGDVVVPFFRAGGEQLLYVRWQAADSAPLPEVVVRARSNPDYQDPLRVDYSWAVVDPTDELKFWFAHRAKRTNGGGETVLVRVNP